MPSEIGQNGQNPVFWIFGPPFAKTKKLRPDSLFICSMTDLLVNFLQLTCTFWVAPDAPDAGPRYTYPGPSRVHFFFFFRRNERHMRY